MKFNDLLRCMRRFPPFLVRLIARHPGKRAVPMTSSEIAERSGRSAKWVAVISAKTEWDDVVWRDVMTFLTATGLIERKFSREREYVRRSVLGGAKTMLTHIDRLPKSERQFLNGLMNTNQDKLATLIKHEF